MKKILIIGDNSKIGEEPARINSFQEYLSSTLGDNCSIDTLFYDDIVFALQKNAFSAVAPAKGIDLSQYQAIYLRGKRADEYFIAKFCAFHSIPCINDYSMFYSGNKLAQTVVFLERGVDFIATYYCADQKMLVEHAAKTLGYPYILKANKASHGDSNYLIKSAADAQGALRDEPDIDFIVQEFCPNECDYRLLLVGEEALLFERRAGADTHLNNTSKGGSAMAIDIDRLPDQTVLEAKQLAKHLGLKIAGFDIIPKLGTPELYFLEINFQPQLRTGALLAEKQALLRSLFASL